MARAWLFLAALASWIVQLNPLIAQTTSGALVGVVTDPSGAVVVNAIVQARNVGTNVVNEAASNESGLYEFPLLLPGTYVLTVESSGFQRDTTGEIKLHAGDKPRIDFQLKIGKPTQTINVVASAPLVNATTTEIGVVVDSQKVTDLPLNGRTFTQLVSLQAGYDLAGGISDRGGVSLHGLPSSGNNWLLDGVDMSFGENNGAGIAGSGVGPLAVINTVSVDALEEFKTSSGAFSAEYGRAIGGVINLTTKSGTNTFHGTLFEFFRNDKLDANNFFSNRSGLPRPPLRHNQFGGNFSGPILRNKLFFFFNYEGARIREAQEVTGNVATPLLLSEIKNPALVQHLETSLPSTYTPTSDPLIGFHRRNDVIMSDQDTTLSRVDAFLGKHRLGFRLVWNAGAISRPLLREDVRQIFPLPTKNFAISDQWNISPRIINEFRLGYNSSPNARAIVSNDSKNNQQVLGQTIQAVDSTGVLGTPLSFTGNFDLLNATSRSYSFTDNFVWMRGTHTLKAGFEFRNLDSIRDQVHAVRYYYNSLQDLIVDNSYAYMISIGNPGHGYNFWTDSGYVQDDWKINKRIQLNLGMRYEYYTPWKGGYGLATRDPFGARTKPGEPIWSADKNNFAPRVGLVVDLTGKGQTVLRSGFAISYQPSQPYFYWDLPFVAPNLPAFPVVNAVDFPASFRPIVYPALTYSFVQQVIADPSKIPAGLAFGYNVPDHDRRDEYSTLWNLSIQHALTQSLVIQASYVGNRGLKLFAGRLVNPLDPNTQTRPHADIGPVWLLENAGRSWNHALEVSVNKRLSKRLTFDAFYTWSKTMQYYNADGTGYLDNITQDFSNIAGSVGPSVDDITHRLKFVYSYEIPTPSFVGHSLLGRSVLSGWTVQGIIGARSGLPANVVLGQDAVGNGRADGQRPDAVSGVSPYAKSSDPLLWLNPAAFDATTPIQQRRFGDLGYNTVRGPTAFMWDASIHKIFQLRESQQLLFRFEMFNWLNHTVLGDCNYASCGFPNTTLNDPNFGYLLSAADPRNIQLALKYTF
ncbi:MAG TPA: TonB-dependent receptor [Terriglobales bacterium]